MVNFCKMMFRDDIYDGIQATSTTVRENFHPLIYLRCILSRQFTPPPIDYFITFLMSLYAITWQNDKYWAEIISMGV
jgi:hypothetical protein